MALLLDANEDGEMLRSFGAITPHYEILSLYLGILFTLYYTAHTAQMLLFFFV